MARRVFLVVSLVAVVALGVVLGAGALGSSARSALGAARMSASVDDANAVAIQKDGRIVVGGDYNASYGGGFAVSRFTRDGRLDASFGSGGKARIDPGAKGDAAVFAVALPPDGKIVAAGRSTARAGCTYLHPCGRGQTLSHYAFMLVRYTRAGLLDAGFGSGGKVLTTLGGTVDGAFAVALQRDGKIVAAGSSGDTESARIALVRYSKSGQLDTSFGSGGKVMTALATIDRASAVMVQPDGKIVVAGESYNYGKNSYDFALVRYTANGKLDTSFGAGGKVLTSFGAKSGERAYGAVLQRDGKIVAVGYSNAYGGEDVAVARYTEAGRLDANFGRGGKVVTDLGGGGDKAWAVALQRDGKIVVAGNKGIFGGVLLRYMTSGKLDPSFGRGGKVLTKNGPRPLDHPTAVAVQPDERIVVTGWNFSGESFPVARYLNSGKPDGTFG